LEPEVHIISAHLQLVKGYFVMTNLQLKGGKEIDILAINPTTGEKLHVESRVTIEPGFRIRAKDTRTAVGRMHRRGLDTLSKEKFEHPVVKRKVQEIFGAAQYKKVLVVWEVEDTSVVEVAKEDYGIEIWRMSDLLKELKEVIGTRPYRDDVLRTIQLISKTLPQ